MKKIFIILGCILMTVVTLFLGPHGINPFLNGNSGDTIISLRIMRMTASVLVGAALGASGAVLQGLFRNPLADPYILGISGGAALCASLPLVYGITPLGSLTLPVSAFSGAFLSGIILGFLGRRHGRIDPGRLLLSGVGLGFFFSALLMLAVTVSTEAGFRKTAIWMSGDMSQADWSAIPFGFVFFLAGLLGSVIKSRSLNALMLGDEIAHGLGFDPSRERSFLFASACLMVAASIAVGGMVGFIGLMIPHVVRSLSGSDARSLIPLSGCAGAVLLCMADAAGRTVLSPSEIPSGIITALIGAPYFLILLRKKDTMWTL